MPTAANVTIKKNDGTTDIVYTLVAASAGDKIPAVWRSNTVGTANAHRPTMQAWAYPNGQKTARRVQGKFEYPTTVIDTQGKTQIADKFIGEINCLVPQGMPDTDTNEAASQFCNWVAAALFKQMVKDGFAAT